MKRKVRHAMLAVVGLGASVWAGQEEDGRAPATRWEAPPEAREVPNPLPLSSDVLAEGKALYQRNCQLCHGASGRGNGPATQYVKPAPADISTAAAQEAMSDGGIFWKLTTGKQPMPPFGKKLTERERWVLVHYVRSLKVEG